MRGRARYHLDARVLDPTFIRWPLVPVCALSACQAYHTSCLPACNLQVGGPQNGAHSVIAHAENSNAANA